MTWDWEKLQEKRRRQGGGSGGGGGGPQPPDFDKIKNVFQNLKNFKFRGVKIVVALVVLLWLASGIYIVNPDEVGVVQRFGEFTRITQPGPHYHIPYPVESVKTPSVTEIKRIEIGFRTPQYETTMGQSTFQAVPKESLMLTGDENIVDVQFIVQYRIKQAQNYLFNISQPQKTVKDAAEAAMRDVIGSNEIEAVLTTEKFAVQNETMALLQKILDSYESGIRVTAVKLQDVHPPEQVSDAFKDVASAREDKSRLINQAKSYRNDILPKARGRVASMLNEAEAYKESKIRQAKGESERFLKLLREFEKAPEVTRKRLYLEAMQDVYADTERKLILSGEASERMVPYLPLNELQGGKRRSGRNSTSDRQSQE
jgi:membrane protease subunit HflK